MEHDNELIQLFFPPEEENVTWIKRTPRTKSKEIDQKQVESLDTKTSVYSKVKGSIKTDCIICKKMIETSEYSKHLLEEHPVEYQKMSNKVKFNSLKKQKISVNQLSKRGSEIQSRLSEIKTIIKSSSLAQKEIKELTEELLNFKDELKYHKSSFTNLDNISGKLNQIENYLTKLGNLEKNQEILIISEPKKTADSNQNGKTIRGIEIQKILANLQEETKRKDLNPIEKENLQNTLLSLQKEMTENIDKFSKFDSIPVRLDQVANYLDRLKDKETQTNKGVNSSLSNKPNKEQQGKESSNKKEKIKVIWKFGL